VRAAIRPCDRIGRGALKKHGAEWGGELGEKQSTRGAARESEKAGLLAVQGEHGAEARAAAESGGGWRGPCWGVHSG
jgi:hypothetical protein